MKIKSIDQIPDNPLKMPPPYWRSPCAVFHIEESLSNLLTLLDQLIIINENTDKKLAIYFSRKPKPKEGDQEFAEICNELWELEHKIRLNIEISILMAAIEAEATINQFCVYNIAKDIVESIEEINPCKKLKVASAAVGKPGVKSKAPYEALKKLTSWRNAFAHGHCTDRPTKSLRHNHLIEPPEFPGVPSYIKLLISMLGGFVKIEPYLASISKNPYTAGKSIHIENIKKIINKIKKFKFKGTNLYYTVSTK